MRDRLQEAIELRSTGRAEEARTILLNLVAASPDDAEINLQTAYVHDTLGREREAVPFMSGQLSRDSQTTIWKEHCLAWEAAIGH
jgi:hypothetical protein